MSKPLIQIGDEVREMNDAEVAQRQLDIQTAEAVKAEAEAAAAIRQSALAKLAAIGLTDDEINAIVGGV